MFYETESHYAALHGRKLSLIFRAIAFSSEIFHTTVFTSIEHSSDFVVAQS